MARSSIDSYSEWPKKRGEERRGEWRARAMELGGTRKGRFLLTAILKQILSARGAPSDPADKNLEQPGHFSRRPL